MKKIIVLSLLIYSTNLMAQKTARPDSLKPWTISLLTNLNINESSFVNWAAGGESTIFTSGLVDFNANYKKDKWIFENRIKIAYGKNYTFKSKKVKKIDDQINIDSKLGREITKSLYSTILMNFRTQLDDGFNYPDDSTILSRLLAPGYLTLSLGLDWKPNKDFSAYLSPFAGKFTFVMDEKLANEGAFGVTGAEYNAQNEIISKGKNVYAEMGAALILKYKKSLMKNVLFNTKVECFSNYLHNPQNIDIIAEMAFNFKVNDFLSTSLQFNFIYDDDIDITNTDDNGVVSVGPRTQFKQVMALGVFYTFKNKK